jgi:hypothetical protein
VLAAIAFIGVVLIVVAIFCGCKTTVYYPNGKPAMTTYGNSDELEFNGKELALRTKGLNHSVPTAAGGRVLSNAITAGAGAITASGALNLLK